MAVAIIAAAFERFHSQRSLGRAREANERAQEAEKAHPKSGLHRPASTRISTSAASEDRKRDSNV
jgi:hypothetical protein